MEDPSSLFITLQAVDRLPGHDVNNVEEHRRLLIVGDTFVKHNLGRTHNRFICCSIDLKRIIWSKSRDDYFKGKFKGELNVDDITEVRLFFFPVSLVPSFSSHTSILHNCRSKG